MENLTGKTALVTGGARRIGRAVARALARKGVNVVVHYLTSGKEAREVAASLERTGVAAWTVQADLGEPDQVRSLFEQSERVSGGINYVVNCASVFPRHTLWEVEAQDIASVTQVNAISPFLLGRMLAATGREGAIVNFLDSTIVRPDFDHIAYHLSKRTFFTLTLLMASEFAPKVRVNAVAPGPVLPPGGKDAEYLREKAAEIPLPRPGRTEDVAEGTVFLLRNDFITGQILFIDGGGHLKGCIYGGL